MMCHMSKSKSKSSICIQCRAIMSKKGQIWQCLELVLLNQRSARLRFSAQHFACIVGKRRGKFRHKKSNSEILVVYKASQFTGLLHVKFSIKRANNQNNLENHLEKLFCSFRTFFNNLIYSFGLLSSFM